MKKEMIVVLFVFCLLTGCSKNSFSQLSSETSVSSSSSSKTSSSSSNSTTSFQDEWNKNHGVIPTIDLVNRTIIYGLYPQTNVSDSELASSLNDLTTPESNGWYLYQNEYYAKLKATPYKSTYTFANGTTIVTGNTYWFKCKPITWNVLSNNNGEYYILSSVLLDVQDYYNLTSSESGATDYQGNSTTSTVYSNNYKYSGIRTWLNEDFYNSAFALDNSYIQTTRVDNSASTTDDSSNSCACENTFDKIFLPSYQDYQNSSYGFSTSTSSTSSRYCKTTDYARARGAYCSTDSSYLYNGYYWTRSPNYYSYGSYSYYHAWFVYDDGRLVHGDWSASTSVRPSLSLKIA